MPIDSLKRYVSLRDLLIKERAQLQTRLNEVNEALGDEIPVPSVKSLGGEIPVPFGEEVQTPKGGRRRKRRMSPEGRARIAAAARARWAKAKRAGKTRF